jgi:hypothetical protein
VEAAAAGRAGRCNDMFVKPKSPYSPMFPSEFPSEQGSFEPRPLAGQPQAPDAPEAPDANSTRARLARALVGKQQEVEHPTQAIGNALAPIAQAYNDKKYGSQDDADWAKKAQRYKDMFGVPPTPRG